MAPAWPHAALRMSGFTPIRLQDYVTLHLRNNSGTDRADLVARLHRAIAAHQSGRRCRCGEPIWIIGSAEVGLSCFTCITGEADPSGDYEIDLTEFGPARAGAPDSALGVRPDGVDRRRGSLGAGHRR